jgi:hypothetical protein
MKQFKKIVSNLLLWMSASAFALDAYRGNEGMAFELSSGKMIYSEQHFLHLRDNALVERVTLYRCPNGKPFGRKLLQTKGKAQMPEFETTDTRLGYREGLQTRAKGLTVFYQSSLKKPEKSELLDAKRVMVADAGFDEFVRLNWTALTQGKAVALDFIVPSQLDYLGFKVKWLRKSTFNGEAVQVFKLAPSGILGWVTSGIDVSYADSDRSLRSFSGLSNLRDLSGDNYEAKIDFPRNKETNYPDQSAMQSAKTASLVNSCQ